jgi:hypothetical protein
MHRLERTTGLEPATLTLARSWPTSALSASVRLRADPSSPSSDTSDVSDLS